MITIHFIFYFCPLYCSFITFISLLEGFHINDLSKTKLRFVDLSCAGKRQGSRQFRKTKEFDSRSLFSIKGKVITIAQHYSLVVSGMYRHNITLLTFVLNIGGNMEGTNRIFPFLPRMCLWGQVLLVISLTQRTFNRL